MKEITKKIMDKNNLAEVCEKTRQEASEAFLNSLKQVWGSSFSEVQLRDLWLAELRKNNSLFPSGWYTSLPPKGPPDGIGILIGSETVPARLNYDSLRPEKTHPKPNIFFDPQTGLAYVYASPVDRKTGIIGDFGMTLYKGSNPEIVAYLKKVYLINHKVVESIKPGIRVSDIYFQACEIFNKHGLTNNITSVTDTAGINIGHSVPGTLKGFSQQDLEVIQGQNWQSACDLISRKRVFFNGNADYVFKAGDCFTLEPRLTDPKSPNLPMVSYHTIVRITDSGAILLENFEDVFKFAGMNYMLE